MRKQTILLALDLSLCQDDRPRRQGVLVNNGPSSTARESDAKSQNGKRQSHLLNGASKAGFGKNGGELVVEIVAVKCSCMRYMQLSQRRRNPFRTAESDRAASLITFALVEVRAEPTAHLRNLSSLPATPADGGVLQLRSSRIPLRQFRHRRE